jgi:hypothetical protein
MKYYIHDNGGRPFEVTFEVSVMGKQIIVKKVDFKANEVKKYHKIVLKIPSYARLFVGKCSPIVFECKGNPKFFDGNSLLIHVSAGTYIFIGAMIIQFTISDKIQKFYSPVGPNDVPYPFAVGDKYTYLLGFDNVYVRNSDIIVDKVNDGFYPYTQYYYLLKRFKRFKERIKMFGYKNFRVKTIVKREI